MYDYHSCYVSSTSCYVCRNDSNSMDLHDITMNFFSQKCQQYLNMNLFTLHHCNVYLIQNVHQLYIVLVISWKQYRHSQTLRAYSSYLIWQHPNQNQNFKKWHFQLFSTGSEVYYDIGFTDMTKIKADNLNICFRNRRGMSTSTHGSVSINSIQKPKLSYTSL